jgi:hypothetical protein
VVWVQAQPGDGNTVNTWVALYRATSQGAASTRQVARSSRRAIDSVAKVRPAVSVDEAGRAFATWVENGGLRVARFE